MFGAHVTFAAGLSAAAEPASQALPLYGGMASEGGTWRSVVRLPECSGVMLTPHLAVYAAHCGVQPETVTVGDEQVVPERCEKHPDAPPDTGLVVNTTKTVDLAYCIIPEGYSVVTSHPLFGPAEAVLRRTTAAKVVSFGQTADGDPSGIKNEVDAPLRTVEDEFEVRLPGIGSCPGDSGAPAFVQMPDETWRVAGILSAASTPGCMENVSYVTPLSKHLPWLEAASGMDVTACFDAFAGGRGEVEPCPPDFWRPLPRIEGGCCVSPPATKPAEGLTWVAMLIAIGIAGLARRRAQRDAKPRSWNGHVGRLRWGRAPPRSSASEGKPLRPPVHPCESCCE